VFIIHLSNKQEKCPFQQTKKSLPISPPHLARFTDSKFWFNEMRTVTQWDASPPSKLDLCSTSKKCDAFCNPHEQSSRFDSKSVCCPINHSNAYVQRNFAPAQLSSCSSDNFSKCGFLPGDRRSIPVECDPASAKVAEEVAHRYVENSLENHHFPEAGRCSSVEDTSTFSGDSSLSPSAIAGHDCFSGSPSMRSQYFASFRRKLAKQACASCFSQL